jgi:predicted metal-binding protein
MSDQLIVCTSCGFSRQEEKRDGKTGGEHLFAQVKMLHSQWCRREECMIVSIGCLCICDSPCAIAYVGAGKPTYLFANIDPDSCAADLLTAAELYLDSKDGMVSACSLSVDLRRCRIARIPPASLGGY